MLTTRCIPGGEALEQPAQECSPPDVRTKVREGTEAHRGYGD